MLRFSDGVTIDTSGEPRTLELADGHYAVGHGMLIPANNQEQANILKTKMENWAKSTEIKTFFNSEVN